MRRLLGLAVLSLVVGGQVFAADSPPIEVIIVGGYHMSNPNRDLHDVQSPDVLAPAAQGQIADIDDALARFRPTVVAAEWSADDVRQRYPKYLDGTLAPSRNEVVQLAFRLARQTGARMAGVDVEGDFPYEAVQAYAEAHGEDAILSRANAEVQSRVEQDARLIATSGISAALRFLNEPDRIRDDNGFYRTTLRIGAGADQPGAELLTAWYHRNFLICANLIQLAKPGDRMVVFYGSGHAFLLRQCVAETPGFRLVEANDYLPR